MTKKLRPSALLPVLTENKKYIKKMKFLAKRKEIAAMAERRRGKRNSIKKSGGRVTRKRKDGVSVQGTKKRSIISKAKKSPVGLVKKRSAALSGESKKKNKRKNAGKGENDVGGNETSQGAEQPEEKQMSPGEVEKRMIERAIRGEDGAHDMSFSAVAGGCGTVCGETLPQYGCLPFLENYAEEKRGEVVSADTLLHNAHVFFKKLGKKELAMRRVAARRLREMKDINRRGGDKDGFRYVVPRNVKEVVQQMMNKVAGANEIAFDPEKLASTFGDDDKNKSERPMHRKKRKNSCYSDFYQFQVSRRWTRNAENFLNKGRAYKSMFEASKHQRSIKKL